MGSQLAAGGAARPNGRPDKDKTKDKTASTGAGTRALIGAGIKAQDQGALSNVGAGPTGTNALGKPTSSTGVRQDGNGNDRPRGGTTTSWNYSPGAVQNFPDANAAAVADLLSGAVPVAGALSTAYKGAKALTGEDSTFGPLGDMLGADAGVQQGWQPDRTRGMNGGPGGTDSREIPGRTPYNANVAALIGDDSAQNPWIGDPTQYSDVTLSDRRRPRLTLSQAAAQLLNS